MDSTTSAFTDSPLSITASVAGILTFIAAILATVYVRFTYLRNADAEYFQVKNALSWHKTESAFLLDLINNDEGRSGGEKEYQMFVFVLDQLTKLEERLLSLLEVAETEAGKREGKRREEMGGEKDWTVVPQALRFPSATAVSWLPVRTKALELVRQRDALGSRVLFAQLSMISSRVLVQEVRSTKVEEDQRERLNRLEDSVQLQNEKLQDLETMLFEMNSRLQSNAHQTMTTDSNCSNRAGGGPAKFPHIRNGL